MDLKYRGQYVSGIIAMALQSTLTHQVYPAEGTFKILEMDSATIGLPFIKSLLYCE